MIKNPLGVLSSFSSENMVRYFYCFAYDNMVYQTSNDVLTDVKTSGSSFCCRSQGND